MARQTAEQGRPNGNEIDASVLRPHMALGLVRGRVKKFGVIRGLGKRWLTGRRRIRGGRCKRSMTGTEATSQGRATEAGASRPTGERTRQGGGKQGRQAAGEGPRAPRRAQGRTRQTKLVAAPLSSRQRTARRRRQRARARQARPPAPPSEPPPWQPAAASKMVTSDDIDRSMLRDTGDYVGQDVHYAQPGMLRDDSLIRAATWNAARGFSGHSRDFLLRYVSGFTKTDGPPRRAMDFWAVQEPGPVPAVFPAPVLLPRVSAGRPWTALSPVSTGGVRNRRKPIPERAQVRNRLSEPVPISNWWGGAGFRNRQIGWYVTGTGV